MNRFVAMRRFYLLPLLACSWLVSAVSAAPRLNLAPYPPVAPGAVRWVIQLPGVLSSAGDPGLSSQPADWRVELLAGRLLELDCNGPRLLGQITSETVPGWGYSLYRVSAESRPLTTRMACPGGTPRRRAFVSLVGPATFVPYNPSLPIVVDAPQGLEVRWRVWRAEREQRRAQPQP